MSKILIQKLENSLNTGDLLQWVDSVYAGNQLLPLLGYSSTVDKYISVIKSFLLNNEIDFSHWTRNGLPPAALHINNCLNCGKPFKVTKSKINQKTCSYTCATERYRTGDAHSNYVSGKCCYRNHALNHYGSLCNRCGYSNKTALEVHHKDRDRSNNEISNLEVLCRNCHSLEHGGIT